MGILYLFATYFSTLISLIIAILLFVRRKSNERSRNILAFSNLLGAICYAYLFITVYQTRSVDPFVSEKILLVAVFMATVYIMYPIEIILPEFFNVKRTIQHFTVCLVSIGIYIVSILFHIDFVTHTSFSEFYENIFSFNVLFRLLLCVLIFSPLISLFHIRKRYNYYHNTDKKWIKKFTILFIINNIAYLFLFIIPSVHLKILYCNISIMCSLLIAYLELFERIIRTPANIKETIPIKEPDIINTLPPKIRISPIKNAITDSRNEILSERLQNYMDKQNAYCDPDLSITTLATKLRTNRTTLSIVIQEMGYENFTTYINSLRINAFIERVNSNKEINFQDAFYDVGFRSRTTATRNFRLVTGMTPSVYFQQISQD